MQNDELKKISYSVDKLGKYISKLENEIRRLSNREKDRCDFYTYKIVKAIMVNICNGYDEITALAIVHEDYSNILKLEHIKMIWNESKRQRNSLNLYARIYLVKKMRIAGYSLNDIALTLGVSITTITKLLKSHCVLD